LPEDLEILPEPHKVQAYKACTRAVQTGDTPPSPPKRSNWSGRGEGVHTARRRARQRTGRVLASVEEELRDAPWYTERWLGEVLDGVERAFDASCDRWHTLYRAALSQRVTQNKIIGDASRSQRDKDQARRLRREAEAQLDLLISEADGVTFSNFYSYRYFASEGFFSGYSFPRLRLRPWLRPPPRPARQRRLRGRLLRLPNELHEPDGPSHPRPPEHPQPPLAADRRPRASPTLGTRSEHLQRLERQAGSTLEKKWLAFIEDHGYRLPSHAQRLFAEASTRPDFFYDGDYGAAIYIDGPHHDYPERQNRDAAKTEAMEDLGYMAIRFGHQDDWNEMINQYPYISGARYESRRTPRYTTPVRNCE
jgi:hypothetical protein